MIKDRVGCHLIGATAKLADVEHLRIRVYCSGGNGGDGGGSEVAATTAESGSGSSSDELASSAKRHCINL